MNKVVAINLNGQAYQVEEAGYDDLKAYMHKAAERLKDDPDKDEIIADLEQAVAEKCDQVLVKGKTVVSEKEVAALLAQMGPVGAEAGNDEAEPGEAGKSKGQPKRFYLIKEGSMIGGVATGIATYFNIDVTVVRLLLVVAAFVTNGVAIVLYILAMIVAPTADTPEKRAAARGEKFNSQDLIEAAKRKYGEISEGNRPLLSRAGDVIRVSLRVLAGFVAVVAFVGLIGVVMAVSGVVWSYLAVGGPAVGGAFGITPTWQVAVFLAAGTVATAIPLAVVTTLSGEYARFGTVKARVWMLVTTTIIFFAALMTFVALPANSPALRESIRHYSHSFTSESGEPGWCIGICE